MKWKGVVFVSLFAVVGAGVPSSAEACLRRKPRKVQKIDRELRDVKRAEHLLAKGKDAAAVKTARRRFKHFTAATGEPDAGKALYNRAQRTIALATVRADGAVDLGKGMRGKTEDERALNLAWATAVLEVQSAAEPNDLVLRTFHAEALMHLPGGEAQAAEILGTLANDDLMPTARGYALLATAQQRLGDVSGRDLSLKRCFDLGEGEDVCSVA